MIRKRLSWVVLSVGIQVVAWAAPAPRVTVNAQGVLQLSPALVRSLKLRRASNGLVCVQFPARGVAAHDHSHEPAKGAPQLSTKMLPEAAPRVWVPLRSDGSVRLPRTPLGSGDGTVPGPAGTVYQVAVEGGRAVLSVVPSATPAGRKKSGFGSGEPHR
jgi:hypothetical protein